MSNGHASDRADPVPDIGRVLITGGAGFIGSHLADELLLRGYRVRALDNLNPQVHGETRERPDYLNPEVELIVGDVRNKEDVERALDGVDAVFHFAALVGVGQSMYQIADYTSVNQFGTAVLLESLMDRPIKRLIVASSMSIYGEGLYRDAQGRRYEEVSRTIDQLRDGEWDPMGLDGEPLDPLPTPETKAPRLASVYALSKYDQERMAMIVGGAYDIPTVALRFFNVYGPRQALSNPYTGVIAIFASRLLNDHRPRIFEDGRQQRDFVSVHDVARACRLAMEQPEAPGHVLNIGSGNRYTIAELAERLAAVMGKSHIAPQITREYRVGDIRHCYADGDLAREVLGYAAQVPLDTGMGELAEWLADQSAQDHVEEAGAELAARGLNIKARTAAPRSTP